MMDVNEKDTNSVLACSPLSIRDYSPSPSTTKNDTPSTTNTSQTTNSQCTPNHTPNPITTLPNISTTHHSIIKLEAHNHAHHPTHPSMLNMNMHNMHSMHIQPSLTGLTCNNKENHNLSLNTTVIPRIPLPNIFMNSNSNLSLPPLPLPIPSELLQSKSTKPTKSKRKLKIKKKAGILSANINKKNNPTLSECKPQKGKKRRKSPRALKLEMPRTRSPEQYSVITSAFNHNLRVKQEHLRDEVIVDTSFDDCYIFSMRCPYTDCCKLFNDMSSYQSHHINKHQRRDKKGKLIQSKVAKWTCPDCGKISASWYNYAAHVTMHKDSCDAPWICKLPPINKKKYVEWTDGTFICGKRCSTKHNLIKHLKALHTSHRIIDLSQSVKAQNNDGDNSGNLRRSPRKNKKRPRFTRTTTISPLPLLNDSGVINVIKNNSYRHRSVPVRGNAFYQPPKKKIKTDPDAVNTSFPTALPIFSTEDNVANFSVNNDVSSVRQQGDFVGLLLEAAQLIETDTGKKGKKTQKSKSNSPPIPPPLSSSSSGSASSLFSSSCDSAPLTMQNVQALLSCIKTIFNASATDLSQPISIENFSQLSAVLALSAAVSGGSMDGTDKAVIDNDTIANLQKYINISNLTDIAAVPIPRTAALHKKANNGHVMPDIAIIPNMPAIYSELSPITATNPAISLPKMPLPPLPPQPISRQSENGLDSLLRLLNYPKRPVQNHQVIPIINKTPTNIMVNTNTFNTYNNVAIPLLPNFNNNAYNSYGYAYNAAYTPNNYNVLSISNTNATKKKDDDNDTVMSNNSVISNNILSALPPIITNENEQRK